jgi:omega-amidase
MSLAQSLKVALVQVAAGADKAANLVKVKEKVTEAATKGAKLVVLPECFNSPYAVSAFPEYAEAIPGGETYTFLSKLAKDSSIFLIGGSIPEKDSSGKYFNTNISFNPQGEEIAKHRKVHLFDIDVPGKIKFKESDVLTPGDKATVFNLEGYGNIGLGICYDIRFPELAAIAARQHNAFAMIYPGAFNTTTGPLHWKLLGRSRATDNQLYVLMASPSRDLNSSYHAYGHSQVIDPWGGMTAEADETEQIVYADLEPSVIDQVRSSVPISTQRRFDVYADMSKNAKVSDK